MTIGNKDCRFNALSGALRCTVNPDGPCEGCYYFEPLRPDEKRQQYVEADHEGFWWIFKTRILLLIFCGALSLASVGLFLLFKYHSFTCLEHFTLQKAFIVLNGAMTLFFGGWAVHFFLMPDCDGGVYPRGKILAFPCSFLAEFFLMHFIEGIGAMTC